MPLYTCEIDLGTGEITRHQNDDYDDCDSYSSAEEARESGEMFGGPGYAEYEVSTTGERVYAESIVSQEDADRLVREYCEAEACKYKDAHLRMVNEGNNETNL